LKPYSHNWQPYSDQAKPPVSCPLLQNFEITSSSSTSNHLNHAPTFCALTLARNAQPACSHIVTCIHYAKSPTRDSPSFPFPSQTRQRCNKSLSSCLPPPSQALPRKSWGIESFRILRSRSLRAGGFHSHTVAKSNFLYRRDLHSSFYLTPSGPSFRNGWLFQWAE
jgi:hypothetical protein